MDLKSINLVSLIHLATVEKLDRRNLEMIFSSLGYEGSGALMLQLTEAGWLTRSPGLFHASQGLIDYALPIVQQAEIMMEELVIWLRPLMENAFVGAKLNQYRTGLFWHGINANWYRFNLIDAGGELVWETRFSSELIAKDSFPHSTQKAYYKYPLQPQFVYLETQLLAHQDWAKAMKSLGRILAG